MVEWIWMEVACPCGISLTVGHPRSAPKTGHDCPHCKTPMRVVSEEVGQVPILGKGGDPEARRKETPVPLPIGSG